MKIAIVGYGKEGQAADKFFTERVDAEGRRNEITVVREYDAGDEEDYRKVMSEGYDLILRSPSVPPREGFSSMTRYFFEHCRLPIIGVTGTKGKGTTCTMIRDLLAAIGVRAALVGNIGVPCIDYLDDAGDDELDKDDAGDGGELDKSGKYDVIVFELSSFQLWDLERSPKVAVVLRIEPDHLNVHKDFADYVAAKGHIAEYQRAGDKIVYFCENKWSRAVAEKSAGEKIPYPVRNASPRLQEILDALAVPGAHNRENAEAALLAVAAYLGVTLGELIDAHFDELRQVLAEFRGLPHHIELVRELNGVEYYDDSFSTTEPSLEVALKAFAGRPVVLIAGGQDKGVDLAPIKRLIFGEPGARKVFLLGEIAGKLAEGEDAERYEIVESLEEAVQKAQKVAEKLGSKAVVLLSPAAASLDMFESYYQRGEMFQEYVKSLK